MHSWLVTDSICEPLLLHDSSQLIIVSCSKVQLDNHIQPKMVRQIYSTPLASPLATALIVSLSS